MTRQPRRSSSVPRTGVARALSKLGFTSRTAAAALVREGRVMVNGRTVADPETPVVLGRDRIAVDGVEVRAAAKRYLMLNKPRGLVTTASDEQGRDTVYDCLPEGERAWLAPVGRLDKASEGLLLFTNDTQWANRLLEPATHLPKRYHVQINALADDALLARLRHGTTLDEGTHLGVVSVERLRSGEKNAWIEVVLDEGKNRHIRRLLEALGIEVLRLVRVAIGPLALGELAKGAARELTQDEVATLARSAR